MAKDAKCDVYSKLISWLVQYFIISTGVFYSSNFPCDGLIKISEKQNFAIATRFFRKAGPQVANNLQVALFIVRLAVLYRQPKLALARTRTLLRRCHMNDSLKAQCGAEFLGTGLFLFFGIGCLSALKVAGASLGLWEICIIWGLGISLAVYLTAGISGGHLNPAVTIALWLFACFPKQKVLPY
ncbi:TPA: aquaporin, partial [Salmonella enterica subsp. enterica serovar Schwarzengrund]